MLAIIVILESKFSSICFQNNLRNNLMLSINISNILGKIIKKNTRRENIYKKIKIKERKKLLKYENYILKISSQVQLS